MRQGLVTTGLVLVWSLAVIAVTAGEALWLAHPSVRRGDPASIEAHLVRALSEAATRKQLGSAALALVQGGRIAAEHGFGVANPETRARVDNGRTLYLVGSVSKAVTAWGVMRLVEQGRIGLDEPVMRHLQRWRFPGSEAYRDHVTVRHLLSHTAGIDDGFSIRGFSPGEPVQTLEESLTHPRDTYGGEPHGVRLARVPGTSMSYSSAGYTILQLLVEEVTTRPFADYMKEEVLQPLGMTSSSFELEAILETGRVQDLAATFDADLRAHPHRRYSAAAAVALRATPHDLGQFVLAYTRNHAVLRRDTLKQMMTPQPATAGTWGLGHTLFVDNGEGGYVVGHDGGAFPAFGASLRVNPATGNGFVLVVSGGGGATNQLVHDWVYWETGKVTQAARLQIVQSRIVPAAVALIGGAFALVVWGVLRTREKPQN